MHIRLLGPVDIVQNGVFRTVEGLRRTAILAALALSPDGALSVDRLIEIVWDGRSTPGSPATLQSHVSLLRRVLGDRNAIVARSRRYQLSPGGWTTDVQTAELLIREARETSDPTDAAGRLQNAAALWRGRPLIGLHELSWFADQAQRLEQVLLAARHELVDIQLAVGRHAEVIPELERLVQQHPLHEQIHGQLMRALYRANRPDDALALYERLRRTLDDDLAAAPSRPLRELHAAILRQDPALDGSAGSAEHGQGVARPAVVVGPALLPPATAGFTGRSQALAHLDSLLADMDAHPAAVVISAISGTAGVGKTALAVHWAHRVRYRFPDGQLYVNLRGYDASGAAMDPTEAIRGFLEALGVAPQCIPATATAQAALYRSLMADKRVLVVLDNARDAQQVRPLLPATPGCLALVTSRSHLGPLVAAEGASPLMLDLLSTTEARDLFTRRLGTARVAGEPEAVDTIIAACARLPLALAIAAARAATHPDFPLTAMATEFAETADPHPASRLAPLHSGDPASNVRTVFFASYRTLSAEAARLFRLLGIHTGPDISVPAAASLAARPFAALPGLLAELVDSGLLTEPAPNRYAFHDLLRAYATEQAHHHDDARRDATLRAVDHYLHTAYNAALLLMPGRDPIELTKPAPGAVPERLTHHDHAKAWFVREHPVLMSAVENAARTGLDSRTWQLAWSLSTFHNRCGHWIDQLTVQKAALAAAQRLDDQIGQAITLRSLGKVATLLSLFADARDYFQQSASLYSTLGDLIGQAHASLGLGVLAEAQGRPTDMLPHAQRALSLYRTAEHQPGIAAGLNAVGWGHALRRDHARAVFYCTQAITLQQQLGDIEGQANTWDSLGYINDGLGDHLQALLCYRRAIDLSRQLGDHHFHGNTLTRLGDCLHRAGDHNAARAEWLHALTILERINDPGTTEVRDRLDNGPHTPRGKGGRVG